ncbi:MAG: hypothetical protein SO181_12630 [Frisingicoccus sp.]|uniref:hypothetical protein n=1 Tax=Frisingicoccus sp. TaxID=1918627 RepID=UPI002A7FB762|nr:hypothetical protein [Frisingicoccus sp.]MDY4835954.1 hypothetical protein [Frisingicoccus sp.]
MSIQTQIDRISESVSAALTALTEKGVTVPDDTKVDGLAALIAAIESGGGGATIATGSFRPSGAFENLTVTHGLGVVPNFAICYRSMSSLVTSRVNAFIYLAKLNGVGTMAAAYPSSQLSGLFKEYGNAGKDTTYAITDTPAEYAPFVGAYGATENKITFGHNYVSGRGDTRFCFDAGWDTYYWIAGVI